MFTFDEKKSTQAAAAFLRMAGGTMNYMVLLKLLYLLDRAAIQKWARPVTGDKCYSMKHGPVLSNVLKLVSEMPEPENSSYWASHISPQTSYAVELTKDPASGALSESEDRLIEEVYAAYGSFKDKPFDLVRHLHETLPEWDEVKEGRRVLSHLKILRAVNPDEEAVARIHDEWKSLSSDMNALNSLYNRA